VTVLGVPDELVAVLADGVTVMSMDMDASRVTFVAHAGQHLARCVSSALALPMLLAGAPILFILAPLVWAVFGVGAAWNTVLVLAGILLMVGVVLAGFMAYDQLREPRWIECQPAGIAERLVMKRILGTETIPVSDVRLVHVQERFKLDQTTGCDVTVALADGRTFTCPRIMGPRVMVPAAELGAWFRRRLGHTGIEVVHETAVERVRLLSNYWYGPARVAAIWNVRVGEVGTIAKRFAVDSEMRTPYVDGTYRYDLTGPVFDPNDVHAVAADVRRAQKRGISQR
jgi:hypothetical protein